MTPAAQHPQRCETCKHYHDETETEYGMCYAEPGHREQMYNNTFDHVGKFGCASHSSAQHQRTCAWTPDEDGVYHTGCGNAFVMGNDDTPAENRFKYCPYCGALLQAEVPK